VFAPVVEDWILGKGDGGLIVHHQSRRANFFPDELAQQPV
jgi:hypothetical protein